MTEQEKEILTIKDRNISISLSDADVQRLFEKAGSIGLSVSELLKNFIGDLVNGTYTNGSDECDMAKQWFNRCWFGMFPDKTFLRHLIEWGQVKNALELWDDIKTGKEEIEYSNTHKDEFTEEEIEGLKEDLEYWHEQLNDIFSEFQRWAKEETIGTLEKEMEKIIKWKDEMESI